MGDCTDIIIDSTELLLNACAPNENMTESTRFTCDGYAITYTEYADANCMYEFNVTTRYSDQCYNDDGYQTYSCDNGVDTTMEIDTDTTMDGTMDGTDNTIVDETEDTSAVDPTAVDNSSAFAVSKVIAVILSVVGSLYFV